MFQNHNHEEEEHVFSQFAWINNKHINTQALKTLDRQGMHGGRLPKGGKV